jgi:fumarate hydratase subunit beta
MKATKKIKIPLEDSTTTSLRAGDRVLITGQVFTARDQAHRRLIELLDEGKPLPIDINGSLIYYVGPTPARPGRVIGAAGPTTSSRMDRFSPALYAAGLKATIGKGSRSPKVIQALKKHKAVHLAATGGAAALLSKHITACQIVAYTELGTEAIRKLYFEEFPAVVAYDTLGNSVYNHEIKGAKK